MSRLNIILLFAIYLSIVIGIFVKIRCIYNRNIKLSNLIIVPLIVFFANIMVAFNITQKQKTAKSFIKSICIGFRYFPVLVSAGAYQLSYNKRYKPKNKSIKRVFDCSKKEIISLNCC